MIFVLYKSSSVPSGRALRAKLTELGKTPVKGGFPILYAQHIRKHGPPSLLVNLGLTEEISEPEKILNSQEMIRAASDKRGARRVFQEKGVPIPPLFLRASDIGEGDLPVIGRTSHHTKGRGFWYCTKMPQIPKAVAGGATHFLGFVPNTREYRVHTFINRKTFSKETEDRRPENYTSVKISEKVWIGQGKPNPSEPQKNHRFGWSFLGQQGRREEELNVVRQAAREAIASLGMDFGAVDVMYHTSTKMPYVLEVNSCPSLADESADTCERYARKILDLSFAIFQKEEKDQFL